MILIALEENGSKRETYWRERHYQDIIGELKRNLGPKRVRVVIIRKNLKGAHLKGRARG